MLNGKKLYVIIGAAGAGTRMGAPVPKQFLQLNGKTILENTAEAFLAEPIVDRIAVAAPLEYLDFIRTLFSEYEEKDKFLFVPGGAHRQDSIRSGLDALRKAGAEDDSLVLIHDGVRPYVSCGLIRRVAEAAAETGAAIPAVSPKDTIRHITEGTLDRSKLCCVQTPQGFRMDIIEKAFSRAYEDNYFGTDDAGLAERIGVSVTIVEGESSNLKITTPEDLKMETRIGTGFDVHRLTDNRKLILGGVEIPFEQGLLGHSDADVLVHALMDAMLGAAALGDIGKLFPDSDDAFKGISSLELLRRVEERIREEGYSLGNADVTVVCQRPRLAPHIAQMRRNIAEVLRVPEDRISIKATTTEKLGFTGRGEGIAAEAVCLLTR